MRLRALESAPGTGKIHYNRVLEQAHERGCHDCLGLESVPIGDERGAVAVAPAEVW